jgi:glycine/D-amino acid oxidase-like deaminating enzyme
MPLRISIIGAGIMGLAGAWALAKRGHQVAVYEQGPVPNPLGSSVDQHRLIRYAYRERDGYVRMVREAYGAWDMLWADLGARFYAETGTLAFDTADDDWAGRSRGSLDRCGIPFETLSTAEMVRRWPQLREEGVENALFLPSGGILMAERVVTALAQHLPTQGVAIHSQTPVKEIDPAQATLTLVDGDRVGADVLIVAAGPWGGRLVPALRQRMTPSRQVLAYLAPPPTYAALWARSPMVLSIGRDAGFYAVPPVAGLGLKIGDHRFSLQGEPDRNRLAGNDEAEAIAGLAKQRFRDHADYRIVMAKTCFYDVEPAERFIVETVGPHTWVMSGFSGHGFKFASILGLRLAAAIDGEIAPEALTAWAAGQAPA